MSSNNPFGGFDFEQLRKMLEQLGFGDAENLNLEDLVAQVSKMQGGAMFGMTNADRDPDQGQPGERPNRMADRKRSRRRGGDRDPHAGQARRIVQ